MIRARCCFYHECCREMGTGLSPESCPSARDGFNVEHDPGMGIERDPDLTPNLILTMEFDPEPDPGVDPQCDPESNPECPRPINDSDLGHNTKPYP